MPTHAHRAHIVHMHAPCAHALATSTMHAPEAHLHADE